MTDWRLQGQERYLKSVSLSKQEYQKYRDGWEHDHCEFCGRKFSKRSEDLNVGYATPDCYHWICEDCYLDFRDTFQWVLVEPPSHPDGPE